MCRRMPASAPPLIIDPVLWVIGEVRTDGDPGCMYTVAVVLSSCGYLLLLDFDYLFIYVQLFYTLFKPLAVVKMLCYMT